MSAYGDLFNEIERLRAHGLGYANTGYDGSNSSFLSGALPIRDINFERVAKNAKTDGIIKAGITELGYQARDLGYFAAGLAADSITAVSNLALSASTALLPDSVKDNVNAVANSILKAGKNSFISGSISVKLPDSYDFFSPVDSYYLLDKSLGVDAVEYYLEKEKLINFTSFLSGAVGLGMGLTNTVLGRAGVGTAANALGDAATWLGSGPLGAAVQGSKLFNSGNVASKFYDLGSNWERAKLAQGALTQAANSNVWALTLNSYPRAKAIATNTVDFTIQAALIDTAVTGMMLYHPFFEGKNAGELFSQVPYTALFAGTVGGLFTGLANYGVLKRTVNSLKPDALKDLDQLNIGAVSDNLPGNAVADLARFRQNYSMHFMPGQDPKDIKTYEGLVEAVTAKQAVDLFEKLNIEKSDMRPLMAMALSKNVDADSVAHLFAHVRAIGRVKQADIPSSASVASKINPETGKIDSVIFDASTGVMRIGEVNPSIGDVVQAMAPTGEFNTIILNTIRDGDKTVDTLGLAGISRKRAATLTEYETLDSVGATLNNVYWARNAEETIATFEKLGTKTRIGPISKGTFNDIAVAESHFIFNDAPLAFQDVVVASAVAKNADVQIGNKIVTAPQAVQAVAALKYNKILDYVSKGFTTERIAQLVNLPEDRVIKAIDNTLPADQYIAFGTAKAVGDVYGTQKYYKFLYGEYDNATNQFVDGVSMNTLAQPLIAADMAQQQARLLAAYDSIASVIDGKTADELFELRKMFNIAEIDPTSLPNATLLRQQTGGFLTPESIAYKVNSILQDAIIKARESFANSNFSSAIKSFTNGPADPRNIKFQSIALQVLDYDFAAGKRALMYRRNANNEVIGITTADVIALENKLAAALASENTRQAKRLQMELADANKVAFKIDFSNDADLVTMFTAYANTTNNVRGKAAVVYNAQGDYGPAQMWVDDLVHIQRPMGNFQAFIRRPIGSYADDGEMILLTANSRTELDEKIARAKTLLANDPQGKSLSDVVVSYDPKYAVEFKRLQGIYDYDRDFHQIAYKALEAENKGKLLYDTVAVPNFELVNAQLKYLEDSTVASIKKSAELLFRDEIATLRAMHDRVQESTKGLVGNKAPNYAEQATSDRFVRTAWGDIADMLTTTPGTSGRFGRLWQDINSNTRDFFNTIAENAAKKFGANSTTNAEKLLEAYQKAFTEAYTVLGYDKNLIAKMYDETIKSLDIRTLGKSFDNTNFTDTVVGKTRSFLTQLALVFDSAAAMLNGISAPINFTPVFRELVNELRAQNRVTPELENFVQTNWIPGLIKDGWAKIVMNPKLSGAEAAVLRVPAGTKYRDYINGLKLFETPKEIVENFRAFELGLDANITTLSAENLIKFSQLAATQSDNNIKNFFMAPLKKIGDAMRYVYGGSEYLVKAGLADIAVQVGLKAGLSKAEIELLAAQAVAMGSGVRYLSQKPDLFRGPVGKAMTMFQTYTFTTGAQFLRAIENGDKAAAIAMAAMHGTLYGLQSLPMVELYNKLAIGSEQRNYSDTYTALRDGLGQDMSNFILYGLASNLTSLGLYNRGDLTPRNVFIVPTNPADWIPVQMIGKFLTTTKYAADLAFALPGGENVGNALMRLIEHNGINRPLANLATRLQGYSTSGKFGTVNYFYDTDPILQRISAGAPQKVGEALAQMGADESFMRWFSYLAAATGARPLNEEILRDTVYRYQYYQVLGAEKRKKLGQAMAMMMQSADPQDFDKRFEFYLQAKKEYLASGGSDKGFKQSWANASINAERGMVEALSSKLSQAQTRALLVSIGADPSEYRYDKLYWMGIRMDERFQ